MRSYYRGVLLSLLLLAGTPEIYACDVCGCSSVSQSLGLLPQFSGHFAGIQYLYATSVSNHPGLLEKDPPEHAAQYFNTVQAWGRYQLSRKFQLFAFVPYVYNVNNDGSSRSVSGIGDVSVSLNTVVLQSERQGSKQILLAGAGIKLPTGAYTGIAATDRDGLPNMQAGTGSTDLLLNANYTFKGRGLGFNLDASGVITTANSSGYKYGNKFAAGALAFYWLEWRHFRLVPQAGFRQEYTLHDYDNYKRRWLNEQSGGYVGFVSAGTQAYYRNWGLKAMIHLPVAQDYATGMVRVQPRIESGIFFLF
jgi:hypothetical protein